ncbi:MAG: hypothetical protein AB7D46_00010 [Flavobacteriaceae bacterium]
MKRLKLLFSGIIFLGLVSCDSPSKESDPEAIARVGADYLYPSDVQDLVPQGTSQEDSVRIVKTYIERWASHKLLTEVAEVNLDEEQKKEFEKLVNQYRIDLYTNAYLEQLVQTSIDTAITKKELELYYDENKENFRLNEKLVKLRYIKVPSEHQKFLQIKERFFKPKKNDKEFWDTYLVQLKAAALNDSVWVEMNQVYRKIPFINPDNASNYIQEGMQIEHKDEEDVYFIKIKEVLPENKISPLEYIEPTIRQVILNRRKLEFIKKIEKEITDDALKNNKYEIYK